MRARHIISLANCVFRRRGFKRGKGGGWGNIALEDDLCDVPVPNASNKLISRLSRRQDGSCGCCSRQDGHSLCVFDSCVVEKVDDADCLGEGFRRSERIYTTPVVVEAGIQETKWIWIATICVEENLDLIVDVGYSTKKVLLINGVEKIRGPSSAAWIVLARWRRDGSIERLCGFCVILVELRSGTLSWDAAQSWTELASCRWALYSR